MSDFDDFGSLDDEDLLLAASQSERPKAPCAGECLDHTTRPSKRRRIASPTDSSPVVATSGPGDTQPRSQWNDHARPYSASVATSNSRSDKNKSHVSSGKENISGARPAKTGEQRQTLFQNGSTRRAGTSGVVNSTATQYRPRPTKSSEGRGFDSQSHPRKSAAGIAASPGPNGTSALDELDGLPSDAFASTPDEAARQPEAILVSSQLTSTAARPSHLRAPKNGLRQTTLFGTQAGPVPASQVNKRMNWPLAAKDEPPTHHKLDEHAMRTWVYPTNLGTVREYQFNIVHKGLFHNLLVALPTGLGKTFIAATIMLNFFRWTKDAQIVFVAPTKPLVSQQVNACFGIAGIPRSQTTLLTGGTLPALRAEEWREKRVFFMTPQTIMNDLTTGICDPKRIVLLVVDEAHRATGGYAYVKLVKLVRRFNQSFRVLALTATPGADVESVQKVINGLDISRIEIRTEQSMDIRQYVHSRNVDKRVFENSEEMIICMDLFSKAVQPVLNQLVGKNAYWSRDPVALTPYGMTKARQNWSISDAGRNASMPLKYMVNNIFTVLASLAHSVDLLKYHGMKPFYNGLKSFQSDSEGRNSKYRKEILENENWAKLMRRLEVWTSQPEFIGHPKLEFLQSVILNHFMDAGANGDRETPATRIMVFAHFRDSAEDIVRVLKSHQPIIRPHVFVGQAASKGSEGMSQKRQLEIIKGFKSGTYNTLVATSIGEEGLDIGEIDLIVCYDSKASPIRMLQRMGRTGRKRAGNIVLLQMKGKEEDDAHKAKDSYEKMQELIASGSKFEFHDDLSRRIVPRHIKPQEDRRVVDIPIENSQDALPEPKRRGKVPKRPPKKFHMPDGVNTGFVTASRMNGDGSDGDESVQKRRAKVAVLELEPIPSVDEVSLDADQALDLQVKYRTVLDDEEEVLLPHLDRHPESQRVLRKTDLVKHGRLTESLVALNRRMRNIDDYEVAELRNNVHLSDLDGEPAANHVVSDPESEPAALTPPRKKTKSRGRFRQSDHAAEAPMSSPPPISSNLRLLSQAVSLGEWDTSGDDVDGEEQPDSELAAFVVDDAEPVPTVSSSLPSSSLPLRPSRPRSRERRQSSDDEDLPDLDEVLGRPKGGRGVTHTRASQQRKRRIVDSEDDDDDD